MEDLSYMMQIWRTAAALGAVQWLAFGFSIIYVILAARENIWCWPFGLVSVVLAFIVYVGPEVRLYSDATLQVYYVGMSVYGWWAWSKRKRLSLSENNLRVPENVLDDPVGINERQESLLTNGELPITTWSLPQHVMAIAGGSVLALLLGYFWTYMNAALPYIDAFTTAFSLIATYMVARKILENWLYWIVIDTVCIFVYWHRELYLFSLLFLIYCLIAVYGYFSWRRQMASI